MDSREDIVIDLKKDEYIQQKEIISDGKSLFYNKAIKKNPRYMNHFLELLYKKYTLQKEIEIIMGNKDLSSGIFFTEYSKYPIIHGLGIILIGSLFLFKSNFYKNLILQIFAFPVLACQVFMHIIKINVLENIVQKNWKDL